MRNFIACILLLLWTMPTIAQTSVIKLADVKTGYKPANYYIAGIADKRANTQRLGILHDEMIDLEGGVAPAIYRYVSNNIKQDTSAIAVTMHLVRFDVTEKQLVGKKQFDLNMVIAYYIGETKLIEYSGTSFSQSIKEAAPYIEKMIRENIAGNMREFDSWMAKNKNNISATPVIEVEVILANTSNNADRITYANSRKLTIGDFKGTPDEASPGVAATMSGIAMEIDGSSLRNVTKAKVTLRVYFDKSRSWMKEAGRNPYVLEHEQRHFDITAIKACQLKDRIQKTTFTPGNYQQELRALLQQVEDEGTEMQNTYDSETEHGVKMEQQQAWNEQITTQLKQQPCY